MDFRNLAAKVKTRYREVLFITPETRGEIVRRATKRIQESKSEAITQLNDLIDLIAATTAIACRGAFILRNDSSEKMIDSIFGTMMHEFIENNALPRDELNKKTAKLASGLSEDREQQTREEIQKFLTYAGIVMIWLVENVVISNKMEQRN